MSRQTETVLAVIASVIAIIIIAFAVCGIIAISNPLSKPDARPGVHVPCLVSLPHCDEPANGIWSTR